MGLNSPLPAASSAQFFLAPEALSCQPGWAAGEGAHAARALSWLLSQPNLVSTTLLLRWHKNPRNCASSSLWAGRGQRKETFRKMLGEKWREKKRQTPAPVWLLKV